MKILTVFRISARVRKFGRTMKRFMVIGAVLLLILGGTILGRHILVGGLKRQIGRSFVIGSAELSWFPPSMIINDMRSLGDSPSIRIKTLAVELPYISLFHNEKSLNVTVIEPVIRFTPKKAAASGGKVRSNLLLPASLPFILKRVEVLRGRLTAVGSEGTAEVTGLDILLTSKGREFELRTSADSGTYSIPKAGLVIGGAVTLRVAGRLNEPMDMTLSVKGPLVNLSGTGKLTKLFDPEFELKTEYDLETSAISAYLRLPFDLAGRAAGQGRLGRKNGRVFFAADMAGGGITAEGLDIGKLTGGVDLNFGGKSKVGLTFLHPTGLEQRLDLDITGGVVNGKVGSFFLDPIMKEINLPWPVKSPAWGTFTYGQKKLSVDAEMRDDNLVESGGRFPLSGRAAVEVDFNRHDILVSSSDMRTSFGRLEARAHWMPGGDLSADLRGTVSDLKRGREFLSVMLKQKFGFPEIRGSGYLDIRVRGRARSPQVDFKGAMSPGGFDLFDAAFVGAEGTIASGGFTGQFRIDDPQLKGDVAVEAGGKGTRVTIRGAEGDLDRIFAGLKLSLPFHGHAAGDFKVSLSSTGTRIEGDFTSPGMTALGFPVSNVKGRLEWKGSTASFPKLDLDIYGGRLGGTLLYSVDGSYDIDLKAQGLDMAQLQKGSGGRLSFRAFGKGRFGQDKLPFDFKVEDLMYSPIRQTRAEGTMHLDIVNGDVLFDVDAAVMPGDNRLKAAVRIPGTNLPVEGQVTGYFTNLDLVAPWNGAKGRADFTTRISGPKDNLVTTTAVDFKGPVLPLPGFPHAVEDFSGALTIGGGKVVIQEMNGSLGGGRMSMSGEVAVGPEGVTGLDLAFNGSDMLLSPFERTKALVDGTGRLVKDKSQFVFEGDFLMKKVNFRRDLSEKLAFMTTAGTAGPSASRGPSFFDGLTLNVRLRSEGGALMENSLGRLSMRFDLTVTGRLDAPVVLGDLDIEKGNIVFQDHSFRILSGRVSFFDPGSLDPYLELRGETFVKDYRITMNVSGPASRMRPEFSSSPPLKSEEVLTLLALGESFQRNYSATERSTTLSSTSLLSSQLSDQAKKKTEGVFSLDSFRLDPYISNTTSAMTARLTLAKKVSKNVMLMYSTNLATERKEIYRMEWSLGHDFTLVAVRDELERIGFDLKIRKRF